MEEGLAECSGSLPLTEESSVVLHPGDAALDGPAPPATTQWSTVVGIVRTELIRAVRCDEVVGKFAKCEVATMATAGLVADAALEKCLWSPEADQLLRETVLCSVRGGRVHHGGQPVGVDEYRDVHTAADSLVADFVASSHCLREGPPGDALEESAAVVLPGEPSCRGRDRAPDRRPPSTP